MHRERGPAMSNRRFNLCLMLLVLFFAVWVVAQQCQSAQGQDLKATEQMSTESEDGQVAVQEDGSPAPAEPIQVSFNSAEELIVYLGILLTSFLVFMRYLSDLLFFVANRTKNTWDNKIADAVGSFVLLLSKITGWFGGGAAKSLR